MNERDDSRLSNLRRGQAKLARALRLGMMREAAAVFAHELSQPLAVILSYATELARRVESGAPDPGLLRETVEAVSGQASRATDLLRQLKQTVRRWQSSPEPVDVNDLAQQVAAFFEEEAEERGVTLRLALEPGVSPVLADRVQLAQVFVALAENAFESIVDTDGNGHEVVIETSVPEPGSVKICVRDSGRGLAPEIAGQLFHRFFSTKPGGMGLGLAISRSIVEGYGGRMGAVENRDRGATFWMALPVGEGNDGG